MRNMFKDQHTQQPLWKTITTSTRTTVLTLIAAGALIIPTGAAMASPIPAHYTFPKRTLHRPAPKRHYPSLHNVYQGVVTQVNTSDSNNISFSILDRQGNSDTIYLTSSTRFARNQSAAQIAVNSFVTVSTINDSSGLLDAQTLVLQKQNDASFNLQGIVASTYLSQNQLNLALSDGTVLSITVNNPALAQLKAGTSVAVRAQLTRSGTFAASNYTVSKVQANQFALEGNVSYQNSQTNQLVLVSPSGAAFAVTMSDTTVLQTGEKVVVNGTLDNSGNFIEQSVTVADATQSSLVIEGMISAVDTTANTLSLVDEEGNTLLLNADPSLLTNLTVGNVYTVAASIPSTGGLLATSISTPLGSNQGKPLELEGTIQAYDSTSGLLTLTGSNSQNYTIQVGSKTIIESEGPAGLGLVAGEIVEVKAQLNTNGSYNALRVEIQGMDSN